MTAFGLRITAGRRRPLGYSGDTGPCAGLDEVAARRDLLLAEASFRDRRRQPARACTSPAPTAGRPPPAAGARRLVLTHVPPWHDPQVALAEARGRYDGPVELARAGAVYEL